MDRKERKYIQTFRQLKTEFMDPVADSLAAITKLFESGMMGRAMSILGKQSGNARADKALVKQFNTAIKGKSPVVNAFSQFIGMEPTDLMRIAGDPALEPYVGPLLTNLLSGQLGQNNGGDLPNRNSGKGIPAMS